METNFQFEGKLLLTVGEAAVALGIGRSKLFEMISRNEIPSVKIHGSRRIPVDLLREWIRSLGESVQAGGRGGSW